MNMKKKNTIGELTQDYKNVKIPENGIAHMEQVIKRAKLEKRRRKNMKNLKGFGIGLAAAVALMVVLPNVSVKAAMAMEKIPVIGGMVDIVTFGRYDFLDETHEAKVDIPKIETEKLAGSGAESVNKSIEEYTSMLVDQFKKDLDENSENHQGLDVNYKVVTDTEKWFTLKLSVLETSASSFESFRYYHINKETGSQVFLKDLFKENSDYITVISENIKSQMKEQMKKDENIQFFLDSEEGMDESDFKQIKADQNFFFDDAGNLVIVFDQYEAAPGYMGAQQFTIPNEVTENILK